MEKIKTKRFALILLAGGKGLRFGSETPKQYLPMKGKPLVLHSLELFISLDIFSEHIVVCDPLYKDIFDKYPNLVFAPNGERRQDSLLHGVEKISSKIDFVCIHDAARPFIKKEQLQKLLISAIEDKAAALGVPVTNTVKQCDENNFVEKSLDRKKLWEMQTPQVISLDLLKKGLLFAKENNIEVTDDISLIELIDHKVRIVKGCYSNLKITTPKDLS